ncbi:B12-binding domain-containing radical SAM protein [bacterium]|nr:B12-binding domain-containing radical SAM protein [bacterium]
MESRTLGSNLNTTSPNVVLIRTPVIQPRHHLSSLRAVPSVGLAYIKAALVRKNYNVSVIDAAGEALFRYRAIENTNLTVNGLNATEIVNMIPNDASIVGVSVMHANEWIYDSFIIKKIHALKPHIKIFIGGENATASAKKILEELPFISAIVLGEGDHIAPIVVDRLHQNRTLEDVSGIAYVNTENQVIFTERKPPETSPDMFREPDWSGFPMEKYFQAKTSISSHNEKSITMLATRGCPHTCTFCTVPNMWNSKWNSRTPRNVVDEMIFYRDQYGIEHIDFVDLTFALSKAWTKEFCEILITEKVNLRWSLPIGTRVESLDYEILTLLKTAGCVRILFSPESGSSLTLLRIKKKLNISKMEQVIRDSVDLGLIIKLATIFGFPGQTKKEAFKTIFFIWKAALIGVRDVVCLSFIPYPGTELYNNLVDEGRFDPKVQPVRLNNDITSMVSWSSDIPSWSMQYLCFFGMASFYSLQFLFRPHRLVELFKNVFIIKRPQTNLESLIYCFFFRITIKHEESESLAV